MGCNAHLETQKNITLQQPDASRVPVYNNQGPWRHVLWLWWNVAFPLSRFWLKDLLLPDFKMIRLRVQNINVHVEHFRGSLGFRQPRNVSVFREDRHEPLSFSYTVHDFFCSLCITVLYYFLDKIVNSMATSKTLENPTEMWDVTGQTHSIGTMESNDKVLLTRPRSIFGTPGPFSLRSVFSDEFIHNCIL